MNFRSTSVRLVLLGSAALFATGAWALPPVAGDTITRTETVKYRPTEVATEEGAQRLYRRLQAAADRVCSDPQPRRPLLDGMAASHAACVREALDGAVRQLHQPVVSMLRQNGSAAGKQAVASR